MGCGTTTSNESATAAKCGSCCSGACNTGAIGCTSGSRVWPDHEAVLRPDSCEMMPPSSGQEATEESLGTGVDPAVRARVLRWAAGLSVGFWLTVALLGLRGCVK